MKCYKYVRRIQGRRRAVPVSWGDTPELAQPYKTASEPELCGGNIIANAELEVYPTWGSSYTDIHIEYRCEKCGFVYTDIGTMPETLSQLSDFLTQAIAKL